jgi:flagellin-like protein
MKNTKKRGISPVIATVILVAIAIVISIAAAFWMTGLLSSFTAYEKLQISASIYKSSSTDNKYNLIVNITNAGTGNSTVVNLLINDKPYTSYSSSDLKVYLYQTPKIVYTTFPVGFAPGVSIGIQLTGISPSGDFNPGKIVKVTIVTASGTYERQITITS